MWGRTYDEQQGNPGVKGFSPATLARADCYFGMIGDPLQMWVDELDTEHDSIAHDCEMVILNNPRTHAGQAGNTPNDLNARYWQGGDFEKGPYWNKFLASTRYSSLNPIPSLFVSGESLLNAGTMRTPADTEYEFDIEYIYDFEFRNRVSTANMMWTDEHSWKVGDFVPGDDHGYMTRRGLYNIGCHPIFYPISIIMKIPDHSFDPNWERQQKKEAKKAQAELRRSARLAAIKEQEEKILNE